MLSDKSPSLTVKNVEGIQSPKNTLKLIKDFKGKVGSTGYNFYKMFAVTVEWNKIGKIALTVKLSFITENQFW